MPRSRFIRWWSRPPSAPAHPVHPQTTAQPTQVEWSASTPVMPTMTFGLGRASKVADGFGIQDSVAGRDHVEKRSHDPQPRSRTGRATVHGQGTSRLQFRMLFLVISILPGMGNRMSSLNIWTGNPFHKTAFHSERSPFNMGAEVGAITSFFLLIEKGHTRREVVFKLSIT